MKKYLAFGLPVAALAVAGTAAGAAAFGSDGPDNLPSALSADIGATLDDELLTLQEEDTDDPEAAVDTFLQRLAEKIGVDEQTLRDAIGETSLDMLEEAVANGDISQEVADRIRERIESGELAGPFFGGREFRHGIGDRPGLIFGIAAGIEDVADYLGLTIDELGEALADGSNLGEVAEANGKTTDELRQFLTDSITGSVNDAVAEGAITQERAGSILENVDEHVDALINGELRFHHRHGIHHGGPFGGGFFGGGDDEDNGSEGDESESDEASMNAA